MGGFRVGTLYGPIAEVSLGDPRAGERRGHCRSQRPDDVRVYRPENAKGTLPVVIYTHGGGWVLGDRETYDRLVRELAVGANAVGVFVDYECLPCRGGALHRAPP